MWYRLGTGGVPRSRKIKFPLGSELRTVGGFALSNSYIIYRFIIFILRLFHGKEWTSLPMPELLTTAYQSKDYERICGEPSVMSPGRPNRSRDCTALFHSSPPPQKKKKEQTLRRLTFKCKIEKIVLVISLKYRQVTHSTLMSLNVLMYVRTIQRF